jgi:DNA-binding transcriptional ArsR family regulator
MSSDEVFKAMADPTRRKILRMLRHREMAAGEIAEQFSISGPSMSHHFSVLKSADLISGRREGQQIVYSLNTTVVQDLLTVLFDTFKPQEPAGEEI